MDTNHLLNKIDRIIGFCCDSQKQTQLDDEIVADLAAYVCILLYGYFEISVKDMISNYSDRHPGEKLDDVQTKNHHNFKPKELFKFLGHFSSHWEYIAKQKILPDTQMYDTLRSLVADRNGIAHGESVDLRIVNIVEYKKQIVELLQLINGIINPVANP